MGDRRERGGYAAGDTRVEDLPTPPASVTVAADPPGRVWGVRHPQGWGLGPERVSVHITGHPFGSRREALAERDACNTDCEYDDRGLHTLVYRDTAPWVDE